MTEQVAGLTMSVDVSSVDNAAKSLKNFKQTVQGAAGGMHEFVDAERVAAQLAKDAARETQNQKAAFTALAGSIDPTVKKMANLKNQAAQLEKAWAKGIVPDEKYFDLSDILETQMNDIVRQRSRMTESGRELAAAEKQTQRDIAQAARQSAQQVAQAEKTRAREAAVAAREQARALADQEKAKQRAVVAGQTFVQQLEQEVLMLGKTRAEMLQIKAAQMGVSEAAAPFIAQLKNQTGQLKLAGVSAGQYNQAMRMLPAQITDVATSLAGGMPIWLVAIQQGGQIKDSFGGIGNTFKVLLSFMNPGIVAFGALAAILGVVTFESMKTNAQLKEAGTIVRESLGGSGKAADELAANLVKISNATGKTLKDVAATFVTSSDTADEAIRKLIDVGIGYRDAKNYVEDYKDASNFTGVNDKIEQHKLKVTEVKQGWVEALGAFMGYSNATITNQSMTDAASKELATRKAAIDTQENMNNKIKEEVALRNRAKERLDKTLESVDSVTRAEKNLKQAREDAAIASRDGDKVSIANGQKLIALREKELAQAKKSQEPKVKKEKKFTNDQATKQTDSYQADTLALQAQLAVLKQHTSENDKIAQQRKTQMVDLAKLAIIEAKVNSGQRLTDDEKSLYLNKERVKQLGEERALAGEAVLAQEQYNQRLFDGNKLVAERQIAMKGLTADTLALSNKEQQRAAERLKLQQDFIAKGAQTNEQGQIINDPGYEAASKASEEFYKKEDEARGNWLAGAKNAFANWGESANDMYTNVGSVATAALDGMSTMMTDFLMTGKANFADFAKSIISMIVKMIVQMAIFNAMSSAFGGGGGFAFGGKANGGIVGKGFAGGGYTGAGGKYEPAGLVHRGEFVFTKEATRRIGVDNLYKMMRGYANGGSVGNMQTTSSGGGAMSIDVSGMEVNVNNGNDPKGMEQGIRTIFLEMIGQACAQGGKVYEYVNAKTGG